MTDQHPLAWQNGQQIPYSEAAVPVWDLGVVAGATISEMARTYRHQPFCMQSHLARLITSCRELGFPLPYSESELAEAASAIVEANTRSLDEKEDLGIVWFVTAGTNPTYVADDTLLDPTVCIHTFKLPFHRWQDAILNGVQLTIPAQQQLPDASFPVQHKTRNRLHWWLADRAAAEIRQGSRALLVDGTGHITETSTACFYAVVDETVLTARNGTLRSTTRDILQDLCTRIGIPFRMMELPVDRIDNYQEAFLSSTPCGLLPVVSINHHNLPGPAGPMIRRLQSEWTQMTNVDTFRQILQSE
ncbi:MAG: aminotransferase class IV [Fuerstiella sp.]|nr:aminotransferase class IV [Fuerstiella sp.]